MFRSSRREFLQWASATGLLELWGCTAKAPKKPPSRASAKVIIVGGGIAGATAAKYLKLLDSSLDITLIEQNAYYLMCPGSNEVMTDLKKFKEMRRNYVWVKETQSVRMVHAEATGADIKRRTVTLEDGSALPYDRLIVAPGIDFRWKAIEGYDDTASLLVPHAWKAGPQTMLLRRQLRAMPNGGVVLITVPGNPYRCPPGPYERASLVAHFLKQYKPRSKVIVLDAKSQFSKQSLFLQGWQELYPGMIEWISSEKEGKIERVDVKSRTVHTEFGDHRADVLNVIPPQKAGKVAQWMGLVDESGWCPVDPKTFESKLAPYVHVIGDACSATPMPKSAFAGNSQAKNCAVAVIDLLHNREPGLPSLINHCYSFLKPDYAISITGVYEYSAKERALTAVSTAETPMNGDRRSEAEYARSWYGTLTKDVFG
jgi:sulfide dehydrogenase [flavocytochrome c] flavoprotein subunit